MHRSSTTAGAAARLFALAIVALAAPIALTGCDAIFGADNTNTNDDDGPRRVPQLPTCSDDSDCDDDERCVDDRCHTQCEGDGDCGGDRDVCDPDRGVCVRCLADADCPSDQTCDADSGECLDTTPDNPDDTCTPDAFGCSDEHTAFVCSHDGQSKTEAPCRDDQRCIDGACHAQVCTPDEVVCAGNARVTCDDTGTATTVTPCSQGCTEPLGCSCVEDACVPRSCEPNAARCVGNSAQQCDAQGLAFSDLHDCGDNTCVAGRCVADTCEAGATLCSGRTLLTCNDTGTAFDAQTCPEACTGTDGTAACTDQVCEPLSTSCVNGATERVCNADGTASADVPCGENEACTGGVCQVVECVPECGLRTCGPDPVCGDSCGDCGGGGATCNASGFCDAPPTGPVMEVVLSWTPSTEDLDLYLSRDPTETSMCTSDTCFFGNCKEGGARPDWDGTGTVSAGDPLLDVADVSHSNPESASLALPQGASSLHFRVGADNFGGVDQATATSASATIRVKLDGVVKGTFSRAVPAGAQWRGVVINWNGSTLSASDDTTVQSSFDCNSQTGTGCFSDSECPADQACVLDFLGLTGNCQAVECVRDNQCTGGKLCSASHTCVAPPLKGWKAACSSGAECHVGFQCDILTHLCEEPCSPTVCTAPSTPGCCTLTGGDTCTADGFLGITGNCNP